MLRGRRVNTPVRKVPPLSQQAQPASGLCLETCQYCI
jgi:hypothetical protein